MFVLTIEPYTYNVSYGENGFSINCNQSEGQDTEIGALAIVELAYFEALSRAAYMPSVDMTEYEVATILEAPISQPDTEFEDGVIY
jgi:hypothetical protein